MGKADISHYVECQIACPPGQVLWAAPAIAFAASILDRTFRFIPYAELIAHQCAESANIGQDVLLHRSDRILRQSLSKDPFFATMFHRIYDGIRTIALEHVREGVVVGGLSCIAFHPINLFQSFITVH